MLKQKLWTGTFIKSLFIMFGIFVASTMMLSALGIYAKDMTGNDKYVGLMTSVFTLGAFAVRFLAGKLTERISIKKVMLLGVATMLIGTVGLLISTDIYTTLLSRVVQGVGFGLSATATGTYVATIMHRTKLLEAVGYLTIAQSLSGVVGPSFGFWIIGADYNHFPSLFLASIVISLLTFILVTTEKNAHATDKVKKSASKIKKEKINNKRILILPVIILFITALTFSAIVSFFAVYAVDKGIEGIGVFFTINAIGMIISRLIISKLVNKFSDFWVLAVSAFVFGVVIFLLTQTSSLSILLCLAVISGFSMGTAEPIVNTYLVKNMPDNKKGFANAIYFSALDGGFTLGAIGWGVIASLRNYAHIFYVAAILQILAVLFALTQLMIAKKIKTN